MKESLFIAIPKKIGTLECSKHRTINTGKVLLRVIMNRLRGKINERVSEEQYGFRKGKGTTNAIFALIMIIERTVEVQKNVFLCVLWILRKHLTQ